MTTPRTPKLSKLLEVEITRKRFITTLFGAVAGVMGFSGIVGLLTKDVVTETSENPGYGKQSYGP
jgi:hypothetical protein